ncbi:hypothetical protein LCGC14_3021320 [marine sediment metagenome]|uniref:Uncharacterized protein n=1 Tax=marine sediment metagenome TaxID=412755 RepID=A0A0F8ZLC5_9ZZZZ
MMQRLQVALSRAVEEIFGPNATIALTEVTEEYDPIWNYMSRDSRVPYGRERFLVDGRSTRAIEIRASVMIDRGVQLPTYPAMVVPQIPPQTSVAGILELPSVSVKTIRIRRAKKRNKRRERRRKAKAEQDAQHAKIAAWCLGNIGRAIELAFQTDHPTLRFSLLEID